MLLLFGGLYETGGVVLQGSDGIKRAAQNFRLPGRQGVGVEAKVTVTHRPEAGRQELVDLTRAHSSLEIVRSSLGL